MSDKKLFIIGLSVFILVFFLFPLELKSSVYFTAVNSTLIDENNNKSLLEDRVIPFSLSKYIGFVSADFKRSRVEIIKDGASYSNSTYINYSKTDKEFEIKDSNGVIRNRILHPGYPFYLGDRLFLIKENGKFISELSGSLELWEKKFNSHITSVSANEDKLLIGFVSGFFCVVDKDGKESFRYEPEGSRIRAVYGAALNEDSSYAAIVSGVDPQRLVLYYRSSKEYKPGFSVDLNSDFRRKVNVLIPRGSDRVFVEGEGGFWVVDINSRNSEFIPAEGRLQDVLYLPENDLYTLSFKGQDRENLKVLNSSNRYVLDSHFDASSFFIELIKNNLYLGIDETFLKVSIQEGQ